MPVVQSSKQGKGLEIRERFHVSVKKLSIFKSHKMLLAVRGDKGIHMIRGPPDYNVTDAFQHDSAKNCKVSLAEFVRNGCLNVQIKSFCPNHFHQISLLIQSFHKTDIFFNKVWQFCISLRLNVFVFQSMAFSSDGQSFAWCNGEALVVAKLDSSGSWNLKWKSDEAKRTAFIAFSPKGTCLATWEVKICYLLAQYNI